MSKIYTVGSKDPYVIKIQRALNELMSQNLKADGDYGPMSASAMRAYQIKQGLPVTGAYDAETHAKMGPFIEARYLSEKDFADAAKMLSMEVAIVKAFQEVESKGAGFLNDGRTVILYERHVFRKQIMDKMAKDPVFVNKMVAYLGLTIPATLNKASIVDEEMGKRFPDIYNKTPGGYTTSGEYDRLKKAQLIDTTSASRSCSWGLFQIMGYHAETLGYASVDAMVLEFSKNEGNQLIGFCKFTLADAKLTRAMRNKEWAVAARIYNGPGYANHNPPYDVRLANAYAKHA